MQTLYYALDLKNDPALIDEYERHHTQVWPQVLTHIRNTGISDMRLYRTGNRLFMVVVAGDDFDPANQTVTNNNDPWTEKWESLMNTYQQPLPHAKPDEKWVQMKQIFQL